MTTTAEKAISLMANAASESDKIKALVRYVSVFCNSTVSVSQFSEILETYTAPERKFHNLDHLLLGFKALTLACTQTGDITVTAHEYVAYAWLYHDIVYDPTSKLNELSSAECATRFIDTSLISKDRIRKMILATTHADDTVNGGDPANPMWFEVQLLLDMDLYGFSRDFQEVKSSEADVRAEYSHVSDADWNNGRPVFLRKLLNREQIYRTDYFHTNFEQKARTNLEQLLVFYSN
jgi:predicted metal-dependent HD superfamily phosphohydrolase